MLLARATTLDTGALQQLAVLLLRHTLATLLNDRTHVQPFWTASNTARVRDGTPYANALSTVRHNAENPPDGVPGASAFLRQRLRPRCAGIDGVHDRSADAMIVKRTQRRCRRSPR